MAESRPLRRCFEVPFGAAVLKITVGISRGSVPLQAEACDSTHKAGLIKDQFGWYRGVFGFVPCLRGEAYLFFGG